jgi:hypothetical protein
LPEALPSLDFAEIEGDSPVGDRLLAQVFGVAPHERRHVVTCQQGTGVNVTVFTHFLPKKLAKLLATMTSSQGDQMSLRKNRRK